MVKTETKETKVLTCAFCLHRGTDVVMTVDHRPHQLGVRSIAACTDTAACVDRQIRARELQRANAH